MILQKSFILFVILLISLFKQPEENKTPDSPDSVHLKNIFSEELNNYNLKLLEDRLINADSTFDTGIIDQVPPGWGKTYLQSLLLKKEGKFSNIYDSLFSYLDKEPFYLPFYNLLIFSASAESRINFIEQAVSERQFTPLVKHYLNSLILKSKAEYSAALDDALKAYEAGGDDYNLLYNLYDISRHTGDYDQGMLYVNKILKLKNIHPSEKAEAYYAAGTLMFLSGKYKEAGKFYQNGFKVASSNNAAQQIARGNINLGILEDLKGNTSEARIYFNKAANLGGSIRDMQIQAHALSELGVSYSFTNELISAKQNYLESYYLFKNLGERQRLSYLSENLGKIYLQLFDYQSAIKYYEEGLKFAGDNKRAQVLNLTGMADVYSNLSNYTKALLYYKEAGKISSEIKEAGLTAEINLGLGILNYNLYRYHNALTYMAAAGEFSVEAEDPFLSARISRETGLIYSAVDSLEKAEALFKQAAELSMENGDPYLEAQTLIDLGNVSALKKDNDNALKQISAGLNLAESNNFKYLISLGELSRGEIFMSMGDFNSAKRSYLKSASVSTELNERNLRIASNQSLAELYNRYGFSEAASSYYMSAMQIIDDVSSSLFSNDEVQISYFSGKRDVYDSYADFLLANRYDAKAFEVIDKSRSRSTVQHLNNLKIREYVKDEDVLNKIYEYDWILNSGLLSDEQSDSINYLYADLKKEIISKHNDLGKYLDKRRILDIKEIQDKIEGDENIVSVYSSNNDTYIFVVSKDHFHNYRVPEGKNEIAKLIKAVSPYFNNDNSSAYFNQHLFSFNGAAAYNLYYIVFRDALKNIPDGKKIIFSPSPEFASFPFEFLVKSYDKNSSPYDYKNKDYLVAHYNISYTSSVNTYIEQKQNKLKNNNKVLVVGNPSINRQLEGYAERRGLLEETGGIPRNVTLLPLKYSAEEVNEVSSILNADKILLDNSATESNFKNNAAFSRIIHLSTHSFLYNKQPVIFFSNSYDAENDGFLEAGEIVQMELNSDLVVLSSCNSGLGRLDESEGVLGMSKAFFETGTKSVIASLWEVNDRYTSVFMSLFYSRIRDGLDKSEALRMAKLDFIKEYSPNPYYWSAFVLNGDTSELQVESHVSIHYYIIGLALILLIALLVSLAFRRNLSTL